jgi:hypothetical protein
MELPELGTLIEVDARQAWPHEALSFTPWLAQHLDALSREIGIPLELEGQEVAVETFSADILARNSRDDTLVLIENQLAIADHSHLGQIMTYLAGLEAHTVIWIALDFRDAHLSAVRWLNDHTTEDYAFFAIKARVVQIGNSPLAPVFDVLIKPNRWEKRLQSVARESQDLSPIGQLRKAFWEHYLLQYPEDGRDGVAGAYSNRWRTVRPAGLVISYYWSVKSVGLFVRGLRGMDSHAVFDILAPHQQLIEEKLGVRMGSEDSEVFLGLELFADTKDPAEWDRLARWLHDKTAHYESVLRELAEE